jgi:hypothetical protein
MSTRTKKGTKDPEECLLAFLEDINCLDALSEWNEPNVFRILKLGRAEIRHSNMLAWLLDPNENHGLGSSFLYGFLSKLPGILPDQQVDMMVNLDFLQLLSSDLTSFQVKREWIRVDKKVNKQDRLDLLILSQELKCIIAIENKIDSGLGEDQLAKYDEKLKKIFPGWYWARVLLAPDLARYNTDDVSWGLLEYNDVSTVLERCYEKHQDNLKDNVKLLIGDYLELLKQDINMDKSQLKKTCSEIYRKHKAALDLIFENREDPIRPVKEICDEWVSQMVQEKKVRKEDLRSNLSCRFRSQALLDYFDDKGQDYYYYEIRLWLNENNNEVGVKMGMVFLKDEKISDSILAKIGAVMAQSKKTKNKDISSGAWQGRTVASEITSFDVQYLEKETVCDFLNNSLNDLDALIRKTIDGKSTTKTGSK